VDDKREVSYQGCTGAISWWAYLAECQVEVEAMGFLDVGSKQGRMVLIQLYRE
jgi:hypothetical protein